MHEGSGFPKDQVKGGTCVLFPVAATWYPLQRGGDRLGLPDCGVVGVALLQEVGLVLLHLLVGLGGPTAPTSCCS